MLNKNSQSPKVCTNNQKSPNPCHCLDVGDSWGLGKPFSDGNCKSVEFKTVLGMKKALDKNFSKRCSTKNILPQISLGEKTHQQNLMDCCPKCGSFNLNQITNLSGIHWGEVRCRDCDRHIRWLSKPENLEAYQERLRQIDSLIPRTTGWENLFLRSIRDRRKLSPKQQEKFNQVVARHLQGGAA